MTSSRPALILSTRLSLHAREMQRQDSFPFARVRSLAASETAARSLVHVCVGPTCAPRRATPAGMRRAPRKVAREGGGTPVEHLSPKGSATTRIPAILRPPRIWSPFGPRTRRRTCVQSLRALSRRGRLADMMDRCISALIRSSLPREPLLLV